MRMKYLQTVAVGLTFLLSASAVQALAVDANGYSSTGVGVGTNGTIDIDANVSADVSATSSNTSNTGANTSASGSDTTNAEATVGPITITRADVSTEGETQATVTTAAAVRTGADLSAFASTVVRTDGDVSAAQASDAAVSLAYKQRAKLFGFIPIFMDATVTVKANGETTISYPWYAFLTVTDSASLESDVKAATAATVAANANVDAKLSAAVQAQLLDEIHAAVKSNLQASLAAEGGASASAQ